MPGPQEYKPPYDPRYDNDFLDSLPGPLRTALRPDLSPLVQMIFRVMYGEPKPFFAPPLTADDLLKTWNRDNMPTKGADSVPEYLPYWRWGLYRDEEDPIFGNWRTNPFMWIDPRDPMSTHDFGRSMGKHFGGWEAIDPF